MPRAEFAALFQKEREARSDESEGEPLPVAEVRRARLDMCDLLLVGVYTTHVHMRSFMQVQTFVRLV